MQNKDVTTGCSSWRDLFLPEQWCWHGVRGPYAHLFLHNGRIISFLSYVVSWNDQCMSLTKEGWRFFFKSIQFESQLSKQPARSKSPWQHSVIWRAKTPPEITVLEENQWYRLRLKQVSRGHSMTRHQGELSNPLFNVNKSQERFTCGPQTCSD